MRIRWFGESWHAPICEERYKVDPPLGKPCLSCREKIFANERGVVMAANPEIEGAFMLELDNGELQIACAYHIDCFVESVVPGAMGTVPRRP